LTRFDTVSTGILLESMLIIGLYVIGLFPR
jgi:hypothetical protein